jgi:putative pyoverdin transport system ATP-binding/permease protein
VKLFLLFFRRKRAAVILAMIAGGLSGLANSSMLAVIDAALQPSPHSAYLGASFIALALCALGTRMTSEQLLLRYAHDAVFNIRAGLARQVVATPLSQIESIGTARILTVLTDDVLTAAGAIPGLLAMLPTLAIVFGCLVYMAWLSLPLLLIALLAMAIGVATYMIPRRLALAPLRAARTHHDALTGHFTALTSGIKELQQHDQKADDFLSRLLVGAADAVRTLTVRGMSIYRVADNWGQLLFLLTIGFFIFIVPKFWSAHTAVLGGFTLVILYLTRPLEFFLAWMPDLARAEIAIQRIEALGFRLGASTPSAPQSDHGPSGEFRTLELRGVRYRYPGDTGRTFSLGPIDFELRRGEVTFLVGGNGSGKTTFAKLLTGLYDPDEGEVRVNSTAIRADQRRSYRRHFSAVFSDSYLFQDLLGHADGDVLARSLLDHLQLAHKVTVENGLLSTTALSQGQKKRLMLLVALLEDRAVYVFDEWAADQDSRFRETFYTELLPALRARGKAVFVITHDDRYFGLSDRLLKLEDGRLVQDENKRSDFVTLASPGSIPPA